MNHLRELLDAVSSGDYEHHSDLINGRSVMTGEFVITAEKAMCFDVGNVSRWTGAHIQKDLLLCPFQCCWYEWEVVGSSDCHQIRGALVFSGDAGLVMQMFVRRHSGPRRWYWMGLAAGDSFDALTLSRTTDPIVRLVMINCCEVVGAFLTALNSKKYTKSIQVSPSEKLQKARARRGKKPLFSYWTLEVSDQRKLVRYLKRSGSHAAPRLHARRAHFRRLKSGATVPVRAAVVGNKHGIVHKDYRWAPHDVEAVA